MFEPNAHYALYESGNREPDQDEQDWLRSEQDKQEWLRAQQQTFTQRQTGTDETTRSGKVRL